MISDEQRKPDGGLGAWIETMEAMGSGGEDAELLCLLLELRRRRENEALRNQPVSQHYKLPDGWKLVPVEPTQRMVIDGFESEPDDHYSEPKDWEEYKAMSGCQQAAHRAKLCWKAMIAIAPKPPTDSTT